jgi:hypothetical protein
MLIQELSHRGHGAEGVKGFHHSFQIPSMKQSKEAQRAQSKTPQTADAEEITRKGQKEIFFDVLNK